MNVTLFLCEKVMVCTITSSTINILDLQLLVEAQTGCTFYVKINYKQHSWGAKLHYAFVFTSLRYTVSQSFSHSASQPVTGVTIYFVVLFFTENKTTYIALFRIFLKNTFIFYFSVYPFFYLFLLFLNTNKFSLLYFVYVNNIITQNFQSSGWS